MIRVRYIRLTSAHPHIAAGAVYIALITPNDVAAIRCHPREGVWATYHFDKSEYEIEENYTYSESDRDKFKMTDFTGAKVDRAPESPFDLRSLGGNIAELIVKFK